MKSWFNFCGRGGRRGCLGRGEGKEPAVNDRKPQCIGRRHGAGQTLGKAPYTLCRYTSRQYSQALHNDGDPPREREGERGAGRALRGTHRLHREEGAGGRAAKLPSLSLSVCLYVRVGLSFLCLRKLLSLTFSLCDSRVPPMGGTWIFQHAEDMNTASAHRKTLSSD